MFSAEILKLYSEPELSEEIVVDVLPSVMVVDNVNVLPPAPSLI